MRYAILKNKRENHLDAKDSPARDPSHPFFVQETDDLTEASSLCTTMKTASKADIVVYDNQSRKVVLK